MEVPRSPAAGILVLDEECPIWASPFDKLGVVPDGGASFLLQAKASPAWLSMSFLRVASSRADEARALGLTRRVAPGRVEAHDEACRGTPRRFRRKPSS